MLQLKLLHIILVSVVFEMFAKLLELDPRFSAVQPAIILKCKPRAISNPII